MIDFDRIWTRLVALARTRAGEEVDLAPPLGFSTRVAALAIAARQQVTGSLNWESLAVRGLAVACILSAVSAFVSWPTEGGGSSGDLADLADPLAEVALLE